MLTELSVGVVVINPPEHWVSTVQNTGDDINALHSLVAEHQDRIVVVSTVPPDYSPPIGLHSYFIGHDSDSFEPAMPPEAIHGYFEFSNFQAQNNINTSSQFSLERDFVRKDSFEPISLQSVAYSSYKKLLTYQGKSEESTLNRWPRNHSGFLFSIARFKAPIRDFSRQTYSLFEECAEEIYGCRLSETKELSELEGKVVILGLVNPAPEQDEAQTIDVTIGPVSAAETQASQISGLIEGQVYIPYRGWAEYAVVGVIGVFFSYVLGVLIFYSAPGERAARRNRTLFTLLSALVLYGFLVLAFAYFYVLLPIASPIASWIVTIVGSGMFWLYRDQQKAIREQKLANVRALLSERQAIVNHASNQLRSIADRVHQDALHHLKLAMDRLELMRIDNLDCDLQVPIEKLLQASESIRSNLQETRLCAKELAISPELKPGLCEAIHKHLEELQVDSELKLKVDSEIDLIDESILNDGWIEARESVFSFYRDAINNVVYHAQPPKGRAAWVKIVLRCQGSQACLQIVNDGGFDQSYLRNLSRGFGAQSMDEATSKLPEGRWSRTITEEGYFQVKLRWSVRDFL
ncbi:sensor histidine kinase [cf. Phormidesmis sp. LEGE 11477]|uniref:sensor histidine kinase n=1 Tax=cf. Phormidesmis sp. LEGE 11477 TaxID=1828680 RepID=UPI001880AD11|nr:hypothetical protein [cf. Phormidesmis sp. LEGE 11477]MBE9060110.1 hypothetical protein [cf. Phormidesmis sp. LEGE 11477]